MSHSRIGWVVVTLLVVLAFSPADACPVCFGDTESNAEQGLNAAIWLLLGVTGSVLGLFSALFLRIRKRVRRLAQGGPAQSAHTV